MSNSAMGAGGRWQWHPGLCAGGERQGKPQLVSLPQTQSSPGQGSGRSFAQAWGKECMSGLSNQCERHRGPSQAGSQPHPKLRPGDRGHLGLWLAVVGREPLCQQQERQRPCKGSLLEGREQVSPSDKASCFQASGSQPQGPPALPAYLHLIWFPVPTQSLFPSQF